MTSSKELFCGICDGRNKYLKAIQYCPECDDAFCNACLEHHGISKATKTHSLISAENYKSLPSFILEIKTVCNEHGEKYQNYCIHHEHPLCKKCIATTHQNCKEIAILDDVIHHKSSRDIENVESRLEETARNIQSISEDKENNLKTLKQQRQDIKEEVETVFRDLTTHFDKLQKDLISRLTNEADKHEKCLESFLHDLKERELKTNHLRDSIGKIKRYASALQTFLGMRRVEELLQQEGNYMEDISARGGLNRVTLLYSREIDVKDVTSRISTFGQISTEDKPSKLTIANRSDRQAQIASSNKPLDRHKEPPNKEYIGVTWTYRALYCYQATAEDELTFREGDILQVSDNSNPDWWYGRKVDFKNKTDFRGLIPSNYIQREDPLFSYEWYIGQASEDKKERLLSRKGNAIGSFLISESESIYDTYELSVLYLNKRKKMPAVHHYKMNRTSTGFNIYDGNTSITIDDKFLPELVAHLSRDACGLCQRLTEPCQQEMEDWEISEDSLSLDEKLKNGKFTVVWKGKWNKAIPVAVAVFNSDPELIESFSSAMNTLKQCTHKHILKMYGVCSPIRYIVTDLMPKGNLLKFLKGSDLNVVTFPALVQTAAQIANGMAYLESKSIIHKDLKARNVLLTENQEAKICGFQLSQTLITDEYDAKRGEKFLVKWSAPEVNLYHKFSVKSDIWSYGILLVELFTFGKPPYDGMQNQEVVKKLQSGYRHPKPDICPDSMYSIMKNCWNDKPALRPTFEFLFSVMEDYFVSTEPHYMEIDNI